MLHINVLGSRVHNLKNINVTIPHKRLTVITGLSGSGKSSLAFDTIFAEGQRRYLNSISASTRSFFCNIERPDVDQITGLSPVIAIKQKTTNRNLRSTVGTITEIYDYLRLLFARIGDAYSYMSGKKMVKYTEEDILKLLINQYNGKKIYLLSPIIQNRKGHYKELFEQLTKKGFLNVRIDGKFQEIVSNLKLNRYKNHTVELVVDKLLITDTYNKKRIKDSIHTCMHYSNGSIMVLELPSNNINYFSHHLICPSTGLSYRDPEPQNFSFNSPYGACIKCKGIGHINQVDKTLVIPYPNLNIYQGGIAPLGKYREILIFKQLEIILKKYKINLQTPLKNFPKEAIDDILNGTTKQTFTNSSIINPSNQFYLFEGIYKYILMQKEQTSSNSARQWANQFIVTTICPECNGQRLNKEALHFFINGKNIADLASIEISDLFNWTNTIESNIEKKKKK